MARKKKSGTCCICGKSGKLSFEHVPPQAAYNKATVIEYKWLDHVQKRKSKGRSIQGGAGAHTLCKDCNNNTGSWYATEYVKWARTCHDIMVLWGKNNIKDGTIYLQNVHPLQYLKQVVTCFFSLYGKDGGGGFANNYPELARFVLDKHNKNLPAGFRFFLNLYSYSEKGNTQLRRLPLAGKITVQYDNSGNVIPLSANLFDEIAHPPFQLIMTQDNHPYNKATEITDFSNFGFDDKVNLGIQLRVLSGDSPYPGAG